MDTILTPAQLVQGSIDLVSLPDVVLQVNQMIHDPEISAKDIGEFISTDPALTARLLKIVNSSFYGYQARIDTLGRAITIIGVEDLQNLVLAASAVDRFNRIPQDLVDMTEFWMRSVNCGIIAQLLARKASVLHSDRLFTAGLLHNLGSLLMYCKMPDACREVLLAANGDQRTVPGLEQEFFGYTYAEVGAELAKHWELPESLTAAIAYHVEPEKGGKHQWDATLVYLGNLFCKTDFQDCSIPEMMAEISDEILELVGLNEKQLLECFSQVPKEFADIVNLILPSTRICY